MSWGDYTYAKLRLAQWGRWGKERGPAMSPSIFGRLVGTAPQLSTGEFFMPLEVMEIDSIVHRADEELKLVLIDYYQHAQSIAEHAARRGITRWAFRRLLTRAEKYVQHEVC